MEKPELTELERLKLENIALKYNVLQQQSAALLQERVAIIQQVENDHPGWKWRDPQGLVPE
jgi:hypothetical protein